MDDILNDKGHTEEILGDLVEERLTPGIGNDEELYEGQYVINVPPGQKAIIRYEIVNR